MKILEIILVAIWGIYSIINFSNWKTIGWTKRIFIVIGILTLLVVGWDTYQDLEKQQLLEKIEASYGELIPESATKPTFSIGEGGARFTTNKNGVFSLCGQELSKVYIKENKLYINIIIRDFGGKVIAVIYENVWTVYDKDYEYNDDDNAFEIVTKGERDVFFHIELKNKLVYIEGNILKKNGYGLRFVNNKDWSLMVPLIPPYPNYSPKGINKIFKYPREKYYGVRETFTN